MVKTMLSIASAAVILFLTSATTASVFAQSSNTTGTNALSPIDSFKDPAGYIIAKKPVYDAPSLDVHHYCSTGSGRILLTCILFDGNSPNSTLIAVDYVISGEQYNSLPEREKPNWQALSPSLAQLEQVISKPNSSANTGTS